MTSPGSRECATPGMGISSCIPRPDRGIFVADNRRNKSAFTLIEVMTAVVVLGIGISSILVLIGQATRAVNTASGVTIQTGLARLAMVEVENKYWQKDAEDIEKSDDFGDDFPNYRYEVEIIEDIDEEVPALHEVNLTVYWNRGDRKSVV